MKVDIAGRHVEITPAIREFTEEKLGKLSRLLDEPVEAHVVLSIAKHRHVAEIQVSARNITLTGTEETGDLYASINEVILKLERQALRHKEKVTDRKHRKSPRDPQVAAEIDARAGDGDSGAPGGTASARIVESRRYRLKPMSAEDAVLELETTQEDLLVFREARSDRINVVYRQPDGNFGLIDPEP